MNKFIIFKIEIIFAITVNFKTLVHFTNFLKFFQKYIQILILVKLSMK